MPISDAQIQTKPDLSKIHLMEPKSSQINWAGLMNECCLLTSGAATAGPDGALLLPGTTKLYNLNLYDTLFKL